MSKLQLCIFFRNSLFFNHLRHLLSAALMACSVCKNETKTSWRRSPLTVVRCCGSALTAHTYVAVGGKNSTGKTRGHSDPDIPSYQPSTYSNDHCLRERVCEFCRWRSQSPLRSLWTCHGGPVELITQVNSHHKLKRCLWRSFRFHYACLLGFSRESSGQKTKTNTLYP